MVSLITGFVKFRYRRSIFVLGRLPFSAGSLEAAVPVVGVAAPVVGGFGVCVGDAGDLLDLFVAVFEGHGEAQGRSVGGGEILPAHLKAKEGLGMEQIFEFEAAVEGAVGGGEGGVARE